MSSDIILLQRLGVIDICLILIYSLYQKRNKRVAVKDRWEFHDWEDENGNMVEGRIHGCNVLGFHPYKDILFFSSFGEHEWMATVHAYHLNSSRVECLGNMTPTWFDQLAANLPELGVHAFFPYTPCWTGEYPQNK
jgi:hypothetical protein